MVAGLLADADWGRELAEAGVGDREKEQLRAHAVGAVAPSTLRSYLSAYGAFGDWCSNKLGKQAADASAVQVAQYLSAIAEQGKAAASIQTALAALKWARKITGASDWTEAPFVKMVTAGLMKQVARPTRRKEPITLAQIEKICATGQGENSKLARLRRKCIFLIGFTGFFRADEMINLKRKNVTWPQKGKFVEIQVEKSKCDQLRGGRTVHIHKAENPRICPVRMVARMMRKQREGPEDRVFQGLRKIKGGHAYSSKKVSYNLLRNVVQRGMAAIGEDPKNFGTHSLRAGGATAAAQANIEPRLVQRHGRWARMESMNAYVQDALVDKLAVSKATLRKKNC
jgi:integrase